MPHTGGVYSFARAAMGPQGGFVTGLAETTEYVMTAGVVIYFSAQYADMIMSELTGFSLDSHGLMPLWWVILYAAFMLIALFSGKLDFGSLWDVKPHRGQQHLSADGRVVIIYFATVGRKRLVLSPEREYAMSGGTQDGPEDMAE
jgi:ethanolamine permease